MLGLFVQEAGTVRGDENPRTLIDRAMQAQGGEAKLAQIQAAVVKVKGFFYFGESQIPVSGEAFFQSSDRYKEVMQISMGDQTMTQIFVFNGNKAWLRIEDQILDLTDDIRTELQKRRYVEQVAGLVALKKKEYNLSWAGTTKVRDKEADVVKVTSAGHPDVRLFFDKATGLLMKTEHRQLDPQELFNQGAKTEILQETFYSDYRAADSVAADEKRLQAANIPCDGPSLMKFFLAKTRTDMEPEKIVTMVKQLGDKSFVVREKASQDLVALGKIAIPFLKEAVKSRDLEMARRAERCLQIVQPDAARKEQERAILAAAVRLLAAKKPDGATEALLAFLPLAGDEVVEREIRAALLALAKGNGKPDPALVKALESKDALCQSAAAEALGKVPLPPGRKIIADAVKRPMKAEIHRDGKLFLKWEVLESAYFNQLEDKLFAKP
jgi:hypothetical protein